MLARSEAQRLSPRKRVKQYPIIYWVPNAHDSGLCVNTSCAMADKCRLLRRARRTDLSPRKFKPSLLADLLDNGEIGVSCRSFKPVAKPVGHAL